MTTSATESGSALHGPVGPLPRAAGPGTADHPHRLLTAADVAVLPSDLPSGAVRYELDNGRLVVMPPSGFSHGSVEGNLVGALKAQGENRGLGKAAGGEVGVILWRDPDRLVGADAVFIANASLPIRMSPEGYLETIPDLVVEVRSKNDTGPQVQRKVDDYLAAGVRLVWVPDPAARTVTAYRKDAEPQVLGEDDFLTAEDIIPGFRYAVRDALRD